MYLTCNSIEKNVQIMKTKTGDIVKIGQSAKIFTFTATALKIMTMISHFKFHFFSTLADIYAV